MSNRSQEYVFHFFSTHSLVTLRRFVSGSASPPETVDVRRLLITCRLSSTEGSGRIFTVLLQGYSWFPALIRHIFKNKARTAKVGHSWNLTTLINSSLVLRRLGAVFLASYSSPQTKKCVNDFFSPRIVEWEVCKMTSMSVSERQLFVAHDIFSARQMVTFIPGVCHWQTFCVRWSSKGIFSSGRLKSKSSPSTRDLPHSYRAVA